MWSVQRANRVGTSAAGFSSARQAGWVWEEGGGRASSELRGGCGDEKGLDFSLTS